jgi:Arc/MetJ-type ribon-helix-helix transcriptional regulator
MILLGKNGEAGIPSMSMNININRKKDGKLKVRVGNKVSVKLSELEFEKIDLMIENGMFSSPSDFVRSAINRQFEYHEEEIINLMQPPAADSAKAVTYAGDINLSSDDFNILKMKHGKCRISVMGTLTIKDDVTVDLFNEVVKYIKVRGKVIATDEIKAVIAQYMTAF